MPQSDGGYVSLGSNARAVYNTTTEPRGTKTVIETVKKALGNVIGAHDDDMLLGPKSNQPFIISSRDRDKIGKTTSIRMPSAPSHTAEEARLLGAMPVDPMDDIELRSVQLQYPNSRGSIEGSCDLRKVTTDKGEILVAVQGDTTKPAILTYHDLGLNYASSFAGFFNYPTMRALLDNFCVYHINAPGQEENAPPFPDDYVYPTMDELAAQLLFVLSQFGLKSVIGLGVGAGANILARFAFQHPDKVGALCLVNCSSTATGWIEWGYQLMNTRNLRTKGMTQGVLDYLMWHHFGHRPEERNMDLVHLYKTQFERSINPTNLAMFIDAYIKRTDLNIARTPSGSPQTVPTLKMPVLNVTGGYSPHVDDTVTFNGRLDPSKTNWLKISDCGLVMEEQPGKLAEAFRLFLQGEGYVPTFTANSGKMFIDAGYMTGGANSPDSCTYNRHVHHQHHINNNCGDEETVFTTITATDQQRGQAAYDSNGNDMIANNTIGDFKLATIRYKNSSNQHAIRITENPLPETATC